MKKIIAIAGIVAIVAVVIGLAMTAFNKPGKPKPYTAQSAGKVLTTYVNARLAGRAEVVGIRCLATKTKDTYACVLALMASSGAGGECDGVTFTLVPGSKEPKVEDVQKLDPSQYCSG